MSKTEELSAEEILARDKAANNELRREERKALTAIPAADLAESPQRMSFLPNSMGEAIQLASIMARSSFVPSHCRDNDGNCLAIIMQANRWGMDPFAVANKAYFVRDGAPPAFESQLVNAVVNSSNVLSGRLRVRFDGEGERLRCTVSGFLRADPADEKVKTQSISRITTRNSPLWKNDPEQQLAYYTTRAWARLWCPEVLLGVYTPDEIDIDPERARNITPPIPRRNQLPDIGGGDDDSFDPNTGEVLDEQTERAIDRERIAAMEGRSVDDDEPVVDTGPDPREAIVADLEGRLARAALAIDINAVVKDWGEHSDAMPDELVQRMITAIAGARKRLGIK